MAKHHLPKSTSPFTSLEAIFLHDKLQVVSSRTPPICSAAILLWAIYNDRLQPERSPQMVVKSRGIPPKMAEQIRLRIYKIHCPEYYGYPNFASAFLSHRFWNLSSFLFFPWPDLCLVSPSSFGGSQDGELDGEWRTGSLARTTDPRCWLLNLTR